MVNTSLYLTTVYPKTVVFSIVFGKISKK